MLLYIKGTKIRNKTKHIPPISKCSGNPGGRENAINPVQLTSAFTCINKVYVHLPVKFQQSSMESLYTVGSHYLEVEGTL